MMETREPDDASRDDHARFRPAHRCLIVLPTYDERENLDQMIAAIGEVIEADVLIVDDNSPDGTGKLADEHAARDAHIHVLHRAGKQGLGTAYIAGFRWALERDYERIIEIDCDFSHDPKDLPRLVEATGNADLAIGSRYVRGGSTEGWTLRRRLLSRAGNTYASLFLGASVRDWTAGFRCFTAEALARIDFDRVNANGYSFQIQMAWAVKKTGGTIAEVPICFVDRRRGTSKMSGGIALEALRRIPLLRFSKLSRSAPRVATETRGEEPIVVLERNESTAAAPSRSTTAPAPNATPSEQHGTRTSPH